MPNKKRRENEILEPDIVRYMYIDGLPMLHFIFYGYIGKAFEAYTTGMPLNKYRKFTPTTASAQAPSTIKIYDILYFKCIYFFTEYFSYHTIIYFAFEQEKFKYSGHYGNLTRATQLKIVLS